MKSDLFDKIQHLQFNTPEAFDKALASIEPNMLHLFALQPSSYASGTMETFRRKFIKFRAVIVKYGLRARDTSLNKELDEYKLKSALLGIGT